MQSPRTNWAGNYAYGARTIVRPASLEEAQEAIAAAERIGFLGSRHSFNAIADSDVLMLFDGLPEVVEVDRRARTVTVSGGMTYGALATALAREQVALANLASLPHISVAGAIATGTHGSGVANGSLATGVAGIQLIRGDGELVWLSRGDPGFDGCVVGLGALGAVVRVSLDIEPAYEVRQRVWEHVPLADVLAGFDEVMSLGYSVSLFTRWAGDIGQVWVKSRVSAGQPEAPVDLPGGTPATGNVHPLPGLDPVHCTPQMGVPGPWFDRLPHFRLGFTPSNGDELQSEFMVDRRHAPAAIEALARVGEVIHPVLHISEIRAVARDALWLSPAYERDTVAFHFTWQRDQRRVEAALASVHDALAPFESRPHWGKVFLADRVAVGSLYPRLGDFVALTERYDPRHAFRNEWLDRIVFGTDS